MGIKLDWSIYRAQRVGRACVKIIEYMFYFAADWLNIRYNICVTKQ